MKTYLLFFITIVGSNLFSAPVPAKAGLDGKKINSALFKIADDLLGGDTLVERAAPHLEFPHTNSEMNRLRFVLPGKIKNTPWKEKGIAEVQSSLSLQAKKRGKVTGVQAISTHKAVTDVLALARYAAPLAKKASDPNAEFKQLIHDLLDKVASAKTLTELHKALLGARNLAVRYVSTQLENAEGDRKEMLQEMKNAYDELDIEADYEKGEVVTIRIKHPEPAAFLGSALADILPQSTTLRITATEMVWDHFSFHEASKERLDELRTTLKRVLTGLEKDKEEEVKETSALFSDALNAFKLVITGDAWNE